MKTVFVLHAFPQPLSEMDVSQAFNRLKPCLVEYDVTWKRSYLTHDRLKLFCEFEAQDAEAVRSACRSADIPVEGVWPVDKIE